MKSYKGFKYEQIFPTTWLVITPSGYRRKVEAASEDELKALIDAL